MNTTTTATALTATGILLLGACGSRSPTPVTAPDEFAWRTFLESSRTVARGDHRAAWEIWPDGEGLITNPAASCVPDERATKTLWESEETPLLPDASPEIKGPPAKKRARLPIAFEAEMVRPPSSGNPMEVRFNRQLCDAVLDRDLHMVEGQEDAFRKHEDISFPDGSAAVKGMWQLVDLQNNKLPKDPACDIASFHSYPVNDHYVNVLLAIHLSFKHPTTPNWFWATWEHQCVSKMDTFGTYAKSGMCCRDTFGRGRDGKPSHALNKLLSQSRAGAEWLNYHLVGTQSDYEKDGLPVILRNYSIEGTTPVSSSCMTCHSRASTDYIDRPLGYLADVKGKPVSLNGRPQPSWYTDPVSFTRRFIRLGFVWTLEAGSIVPNDLPEP